MRIHQIEIKPPCRWLGQSKTIADTAAIPQGWVMCSIDPKPGQRWGGYGTGWIGYALQDRAAEQERAENQRLESLYLSCSAWQARPADPHTCDANFFAMLTSLKAVALISGQPVGTKAAACLAWLDALWGDYYARKASGSTDCDFSAHGGCPHSFLEVRQEAGQ